MENKTLELEHLKAMDDELYAIEHEAAKKCSEITLEYMKGFAEWISKNNYRQLPVYEETQGQNYCFTRWSTGNSYILLTDDKSTFQSTEELINLYFESLENGKNNK